MKCDICNGKVDTMFLGKILGTYIKDAAKKQRVVCFGCQKKFASKEELLKALK